MSNQNIEVYLIGHATKRENNIVKYPDRFNNMPLDWKLDALEDWLDELERKYQELRYLTQEVKGDNHD